MQSLKTLRRMLKSDRWEEWSKLETDQRKGLSRPPAQKPYPQDASLVRLIAPEDLTVGTMPLIEAIGRRRSRREYTEEALTLEELSFLLWAAQGVDLQASQVWDSWLATRGHHSRSILRTVPSAGACHPFETYLLVYHVSGLEAGLYRYLPLEHKLLFLDGGQELKDKTADAFMGWVQKSAALFIWTVIPQRTEWRYSIVSHKMIAQESGHVCQNLYLASEAIGAGTCAIGAYDQAKVDAILGVDGEDEFSIYVAPVGKVDPAKGFHGAH